MNVAVILAAGESRRMGQPKQLLPFGDKTMLECVIDAFRTPRVDEIRVVLGYKADKIAAKIAPSGCKIVRNDHYQQGMFTSIQAGLRALPKKAKLVMIAVCDQPRLKRKTVETLIEEFEKERHKILIPSYNGRQGHPPVLRAVVRQRDSGYGRVADTQAFLRGACRRDYPTCGQRRRLAGGHRRPRDVRGTATTPPAQLRHNTRTF